MLVDVLVCVFEDHTYLGHYVYLYCCDRLRTLTDTKLKLILEIQYIRILLYIFKKVFFKQQFFFICMKYITIKIENPASIPSQLRIFDSRTKLK